MKLSGKSLLVTGGAGFVGSHLVDRLIQESPANLVVVDNFFLGREENLRPARQSFPGLKIIRMDSADLAAMRTVVQAEKIEVAFHLAVIPLLTSLIYPAWVVQSNVAMATTFCELARAGDIGTLVCCSSSEVYGPAQYVPMDEEHALAAVNPYAASKVAADQVVLAYCRTFDIDAAIVRLFNQFGPRQNDDAYAGIIPTVIRRVQAGKPIEIYGDGEQTRDYTFVRDTISGLISICEHENVRHQVLNLGSGREISVNNLVKTMLEVVGVPDHPVIHTPPRPGEVRRQLAGIGLAHELLGFDPHGITHDNLKETIDWYFQE